MADSSYDFVVGTFGTPYLFSLRFTVPSRADSNTGHLKVLKQHEGLGSHSWLHLNPPNETGTTNLYATAWTEPPSLAAYAVHSPTDIRLLNTVATKSRSGYICASATHAYSAGGATGEVFAIDSGTGSFSNGSATNGFKNGSSTSLSIHSVQDLDFVDTTTQRDDGSTMDFGGLRHGSHSADLSPDGSLLYIADIGRNCIWTYSIQPGQQQDHLVLAEKKISPRKHDGPRHVWPHPAGKYVYCLQEHSSVVDVFEVLRSGADDSVKLIHQQGVRIIPQGLPVNEFWADEVRTSFSNGAEPKYLYASTRGLKEGRKGYVAVYELTKEGLVKGAELVPEPQVDSTEGTPEWRDDDQSGLLCMFETATSGGWANAVQPGPTVDGVEYIAMTDSEDGFVFVLSWDGKVLKEAARINLNDGTDVSKGKHGAATAVWL